MGILNRIVEFVEKWRLVFNVIILLYLIFIWFKMPELHWVYGASAILFLVAVVVFAPLTVVICIMVPMLVVANKLMELNKHE